MRARISPFRTDALCPAGIDTNIRDTVWSFRIQRPVFSVELGVHRTAHPQRVLAPGFNQQTLSAKCPEQRSIFYAKHAVVMLTQKWKEAKLRSELNRMSR